MRNKNIKILGLLGIFAFSFGACQDKVVEPEISFSAAPLTVSLGEPVEFTASYGASGYTIFTGDEGHVYEKSAAFLVEDDYTNTIYREADPFIKKYEVNFAELTTVPESVETPNANALQIVGIEDGALKLTTSVEGWGNDLIIKPNVGIGPDATTLNMRMRFANEDLDKDIRLTTTITINGVESQGSWSGGRIYPTTKADASYADVAIDLAGLIDSWKQNSGVEYDVIEAIKIVVGGGPAANRYSGDIYIESISLGMDGYFEFHTGEGMKPIAYNKDVTYEYTYPQAGTYEAVLIATNVGGKTYEGDGYQTGRGDEITANEYGISRQIKRLIITVTE